VQSELVEIAVRALVALIAVLAACGGSGTSSTPATSSAPSTETVATSSVVADDTALVQACADVVGVTAEQAADGTWTISATVRSGDTGWDKYADLWEVWVDGVAVGERVLAHPHETEQPFTRSVAGIDLPAGTQEIEVVARDSINGFCGQTFVLALATPEP
jgi:hypothetical protein